MIQLDLSGWCNCKCDDPVAIAKNPLIRYNTKSTGAAIQAEKAALGFIFSDQAQSDENWYKWVFHEFKNYQHQPNQQLASIEDIIRNNVGYYWERGERLQSPIVSLNIKGGDCDDMAILAVAIAESLGHDARFRFIRVKDSPGWHVYAEVRNGMKPQSEWVPVDPSMPKGHRGYEIPQDKILESIAFERNAVASIQFPAHIIAAMWCEPRQIVHLEGGTLAASGIDWLYAEDLALFPDDAANGLLDKLKAVAQKVGTVFKKVVSTVGNVVQKVAGSPIVQGIANTIMPGAGAALATASNIAGTIGGIVGSGNTQQIMQGALELVSQQNPQLASAIGTAIGSAPIDQTRLDLPIGTSVANMGTDTIVSAGEASAILGIPIDQVKSLTPQAKTVRLMSQLIGKALPGVTSTPAIAAAKPLVTSPVPTQSLKMVGSSASPLTQQFLQPLVMDEREKTSIIEAAQTPVPRLSDWQLSSMEQNVKLLDFIGSKAGEGLLNALPDSMAQQLLPSVLERKLATTEKSAKVAQDLVKAMALPTRELPTDIKDALKIATDADQLTAVNDAWLRLIRDKLAQSGGQLRGEGVIDYSALSSRSIELMGKRESLIGEIVNKLKTVMPTSDAAGSLLQQEYIGRNLSDSILLMFGAGLPVDTVKMYMYKLKDLHREINDLNTAINAVRRNMGV